MNPTRLPLALIFFLAPALLGQDLEEMCPNAKNTGALLGTVSDIDLQVALPGATVRATWEDNGTPGTGEIDTGPDGSFTMCYLPLDLEVSIQAMFATIAGPALSLTLVEPITHQDIGFSLTGRTGETDATDDKMWACVGTPGSPLRIQMSNLVRCDPLWPPLDRCPKQDLERVSATAGSARRGVMKEMLDRLLEDARRVGANALVNVEGDPNAMSALAVKIEVDPSTC